MASKRKVLEALPRTGLLRIAKYYEITGLTAQSKADIVDALAGSREVKLEGAIGLLGRSDLKGICRKLGLDESGREKQGLIDRLMGRDGQTRTPARNTRRVMAKKRSKANADVNVEDYRHSEAKRKNNPPAKIAAEGVVPPLPKVEYSYSPRRPPILRFDPSGTPDQLPDLLQRATERPLTTDEAGILAEALRTQQPWLEWAAKREAESKGFSVDPVALHIHERVSSQAILKVAARQDVERTLFSDPEQEYHEAVQFYQHDIDWTNRLILGDSLQAMSSLAHREDLAGKVQMIYIDPPYGIRYGSNFQPEVGQRMVKDTEAHLSREPEMVKAYRDTWRLGVHTYLTYLRDRLVVCSELLADTGSIFVQIGDENIHVVRNLLDEVFGKEQFLSIITIKKTSPLGSSGLTGAVDYLLWYCRDREQVRYRQIYTERSLDDDRYYSIVEEPSGHRRPLQAEETKSRTNLKDEYRLLASSVLLSSGLTPSCVFPVDYCGKTYTPSSARSWRTNPAGMLRLLKSERLLSTGKTLRYVAYADDFNYTQLFNLWSDTGGGAVVGQKLYAVQTPAKIIERCLLMATEPGDLVIDPTCGSGTTAYVCEQWGRRWISIDTSRVAIAIARQRLLTSKYEYYALKEPDLGIRQGLNYRCVPHITLRDIAQNARLDPIFSNHEAILDTHLRACNKALATVTESVRQKLDLKLIDKQRRDGKRSITDAVSRRWELPTKGGEFEHWTVPFDTDPDWPKELQQAVTEYRKAWRAKMDEVNECIAANVAQEQLVDQPEVVKGVVRVSGPFTVEAVQPPEHSLGTTEGMFGGAPSELEDTFDVKNVESYLDQMTRLLSIDGVRFPNNKEMTFTTA